jgi:hypothetical protein
VISWFSKFAFFQIQLVPLHVGASAAAAPWVAPMLAPKLAAYGFGFSREHISATGGPSLSGAVISPAARHHSHRVKPLELHSGDIDGGSGPLQQRLAEVEEKLAVAEEALSVQRRADAVSSGAGDGDVTTDSIHLSLRDKYGDHASASESPKSVAQLAVTPPAHLQLHITPTPAPREFSTDCETAASAAASSAAPSATYSDDDDSSDEFISLNDDDSAASDDDSAANSGGVSPRVSVYGSGSGVVGAELRVTERAVEFTAGKLQDADAAEERDAAALRAARHAAARAERSLGEERDARAAAEARATESAAQQFAAADELRAALVKARKEQDAAEKHFAEVGLCTR